MGVSDRHTPASVAASWFFARGDALTRETIRTYIETLGNQGRLAVAVLMLAAAVITPTPSTHIALASGALYGYAWGTLSLLMSCASAAVSRVSSMLFSSFCSAAKDSRC